MAPQSVKPYRIVSDGTSMGTHIYDPDGKALGLITELKIHADVGDPLVHAHITQIKNAKESGPLTYKLMPVELDVEIPAKQMQQKKTILKTEKKAPNNGDLLPG